MRPASRRNIYFACVVCVSHLVVWTVTCQAPLSMKFSRQEYWSELPFTSPGDLPDPRDQTQVSRIAGKFFTI